MGRLADGTPRRQTSAASPSHSQTSEISRSKDQGFLVGVQCSAGKDMGAEFKMGYEGYDRIKPLATRGCVFLWVFR
jgi:hypothetical protein